jgi:murein DD-endopeptidase MepM/ murein hydrolase activator NlpD
MYLDKPPLLRPTGRRSKRRRGSASKGSSIVVIGTLVLANYLLFFAGTNDADDLRDAVEQSAPNTTGDSLDREGITVPPGQMLPGMVPIMPENLSPVERDDFGEPIGRQVAGKLKRGTTVIRALAQEGIDDAVAMPAIKAMSELFDFRNARVGNSYHAWLDDEGQLTRFLYQHSPLDIFEVKLQEDGSYAATRKAVPTRTQVARVGCAIRSSLYESIKRCGESHQLGSKVMDLYAWDVDFFQDVRQGDEFRVIVEKLYVNGRFLKYGKVLAAEYNGKFGRNRLVQYTDPAGEEGHFTPEGRAARKEFLKSPLKYTMVSAGTQSNVRGSLRKASPVVYTAKSGTPVWAVSGGTIVFAGKSGSLGTTVTIRHPNGFTSTYGHLARLSSGVKIGHTIDQKTVLGTVGRSGNTKTPQLLFSLRKNGRLVNPLKMHSAESDPIAEAQRMHFEEQIKQLLEDLEETPIIGISEKRS